MNKLSAILLCVFFPLVILSQCDEIFRISTPTRSFDMKPSGSIGEDFIKLGADSLEYSATFSSNLWVGALDPSGNLKIAGPAYTQFLPNSDYVPGPISEITSSGFVNNCNYFGRLWIIKSEEVESVKEAFQAGNLQSENIPLDILEWPAKGNNRFDIGSENGSILQQDLAPFYDHDLDGFYDVLSGDLPIHDNSINYKNLEQVFIPSLMTFSVYNDQTIHQQSQGAPLDIEIQQLNYMLECAEEDSEIAQTLFTNFKLINRGVEDLRDFRVGLWEDSDLICFQDNLIGCSPDLNASFVYNIENSQSCPPFENTLANDIGAIQSTILLNNSLSSYIFINNLTVGMPPPVAVDPTIPIQYFNYLNGFWLDGSPMTIGGNGVNPGSIDQTLYAFSDLPNDPTGWSMANIDLPPGDRRSVTNIGLDNDILIPGQMISIDLANHIIFDGMSTSIALFDEYENKINKVKDIYSELKSNPNFLGKCITGIGVSNEELLSDFEVDIFPNPVHDKLQLKFPNPSSVKIQIMDLEGRLLHSQTVNNENQVSIPFSNFASNMYFVKIIRDGEIIKAKKIVKY